MTGVAHISTPHTSAVLSQAEKYRKAKALSNTIASLCSEPGTAVHEQCMSVLQQRMDAWSKNEDVAVITVHNEGGTDVSEQTGKNGDSRAELAVEAGTDVLDQSEMQPNILADLLAAEGETYSQELMQPSSSANESNAGQRAVDFGSIIMPPAKRCRGRPKGADLTVIGLRKAKEKSSQKSKLAPFTKLNAAEKDDIMLSWFVADEAKAKALAGSLIEECEVEVQPSMC